MRTCAHCTSPIPDTRTARAKYCTPKCSRAANRDSDHPCTISECTRPVRARGLCGSHYNQTHQPNRHAPTPTTCVACGTSILRAHRADRRPTCSPHCRHALEGQQYTGEWAPPQHIRVRAKKLGATIIEDFTALEIFERDNWTCYLCDKPVNQTPDCYDPRSATIDHVTPLSHGGQHTRANVKCACLTCNSSKQDRVAA